MKIIDLKYQHPLIYDRCLEEQKAQGLFPNELADLTERNHCFDWEKTKEGAEFWNTIHNGNFDVFYEQYSKPFHLQSVHFHEDKVNGSSHYHLNYFRATEHFGYVKKETIEKIEANLDNIPVRIYDTKKQ